MDKIFMVHGVPPLALNMLPKLRGNMDEWMTGWAEEYRHYVPHTWLHMCTPNPRRWCRALMACTCDLPRNWRPWVRTSNARVVDLTLLYICVSVDAYFVFIIVHLFVSFSMCICVSFSIAFTCIYYRMRGMCKNIQGCQSGQCMLHFRSATKPSRRVSHVPKRYVFKNI